MPSKLRDQLGEDGFVRIPSALPKDQLEALRAACQDVAQLARAGRWPFVRTLPKQFPPWDSDTSKGTWGVQHLMHPDLPHHDTFAASYFAPYITDAVTEILQCSPNDLVLELYNLLIRPDTNFALRWHRDDISPEVSAQEELTRLQEPMLHAQWNLALYPDSSLVVVPGSHKRPRTEEERCADPFENDLPGQMVVKMDPGDIIFYNNNILHRGVYSSEAERMTLHGSMGIVGADPARARNVLQHGVGAWVDRCDFGKLQDHADDQQISTLAQDMRDRLVAMGSGQVLSFSQPFDE
ncbi:phytanoyl-CoA dioxygenase family protein [Aureobasidium melanogenum CBS 110374]|uniref:Phytanoyl-CoA dioxygenase family protein n=1 Tax=Aureobasidium melanogenum (strain CBS 110374) TaxID=1043003 RepID=A0A074VVP8_AURM1|nr:phytanoyl-CoA dioxygenase family protein [Aureobasidium melanogenum CBS 110374]KEQ61807.1 phytanoyl-CoA dioxygenase family protein [Aureobasidium melanogenum CBS 110374]